jgi:hypothetical protein
MEPRYFFLKQFDTVRELANDHCVQGLTDEQLRYQPKEGLNSIAWMMWHTARCQDYSNILISPGRKQVLNEHWLARLNVSRRDIGTGMTREECAEFNQTIDIGALKAYCDAVAEAVREVARAVSAEELRETLDSERLHRMLEDGAIGNERAAWVPSYLEGKSRGWLLSMAVWHMADHLLGGVACTRRISGIPVGL